MLFGMYVSPIGDVISQHKHSIPSICRWHATICITQPNWLWNFIWQKAALAMCHDRSSRTRCSESYQDWSCRLPSLSNHPVPAPQIRFHDFWRDINLLFGVWTQVGLRNHKLSGGTDRPPAQKVAILGFLLFWPIKSTVMQKMSVCPWGGHNHNPCETKTAELIHVCTK